MRNLAKLQLFSLWRVDPHHEGQERDLLLKLKKYLQAAASYLSLPLAQNDRVLKQRMSLKEAIAILSPQFGMGVLELSRFDAAKPGEANLPLLACSLTKDFVLLLPKPGGKYMVFEGSNARSQVLNSDDIYKRYLNIICLFRQADSKSPLKIAESKRFVANFIPQFLLIGLSSLKIALAALMLLSLCLVGQSASGINIFALLHIEIVFFLGILLSDYFIAVCTTKNWPLLELWSLSALYGRVFSQSLSSYQHLCWRDLWELRVEIKQRLNSYVLKRAPLSLAWAFLVANLLLLVLLKEFYLALFLSIFLSLILLLRYELNKYFYLLSEEERLKQHELDLLLNSLEKSFAMASSLKAQDHIINRLGHLRKKLSDIRQKLSLFTAIKLYAQLAFSLFIMGLCLNVDFAVEEFVLKLIIIIDALLIGQALAQLLDQRCVKKVFTQNIIDRLNLMQGYAGHRIEAAEIKGSIELMRLSFAYPESSFLLFNNFSQSFKAGSCYVLTGPSGSGKSSLLRLLMGFYEPRSGYIVVDGQDIQSLKLSSLRKHFGYVGQNSRLFGGSIAENILAGRSISKEAVLDLLLSHAIFDHILDLPMGLETFVFPRSFHLSLVQINLILLARALVHKPAFLFLDEILVGMSIDEQKQIADFLGSLSITRILISHQKLPSSFCHEEISLKAQ